MIQKLIDTPHLLLGALLLLVLSACSTMPRTTTHTVTVNVAGDGTGTVTSVPEGIDLTSGDDAGTLQVESGTTVTLTAVAAAGSSFDGWTGDCTGTDPCVIEVDSDAGVTATFTLDPVVETRTLTVSADGTGAGNVTSDPAGIDLDAGDASASFDEGTEVTLSASAAVGSSFDGWSGACEGQGASCTIHVEDDTETTATFVLEAVIETHILTVSTAGSGAGNVTSDPAGIDLDNFMSSASFAEGTEITLSATPSAISSFVGWSGVCEGEPAECTFVIDADTSVTATFDAGVFSLIVGADGGGSGNVTSDPAGIDLDAGDTSFDYDVGTPITLTAAADAGSSFVSWTGVCAGQGEECTFTIANATTVTATFELSFTLDVSVVAGGAAAGSVTSDLPGIDTAEGDTSEDYVSGTVVTLTAEATAGAFSGWVGGGCDEVKTPVCSVTIDAAKEVTATFNDVQELTVRVAANGDDAVEFLGDSVEGQNRTPPRWFEGWVWVNVAYLDLGWAPYHNLTEAGLRFPAVTVPAGAIVTSAVVQVTAAPPETADFPTTGDLSLTIAGELSLNPGGFVQPAIDATTFDITDTTIRPRTSASVTWDITAAWAADEVHQAPDASSILQEIIDQPGWSSGNAVVLFMKDPGLDPDDEHYRRIRTFDSGAPATRHPTLLIDYVVMPPLP